MWKIETHKRVNKALKRYPFIKEQFNILMNDLRTKGPYLYQWTHFSKLHDGRFHCWIKSGKPVMVATWVIIDEKNKVL